MSTRAPMFVALALVVCGVAGCGGGGSDRDVRGSDTLTLHGVTFTVARVLPQRGLVSVILESEPANGVDESAVMLIDGDGVPHAPVFRAPVTVQFSGGKLSELGLAFRVSKAALKGAKLRIVVGGTAGTISVDQASHEVVTERTQTSQPAAARPVPKNHPPFKLCKEKGIRYDGMTPEGASVCFTLSADGASLLESAWSFVPASGCPQQATGDDHSTYPEDVGASGHFENPDGFRGTVRGATATGKAEDAEICKGKTFTWTARRLP